MKSHVAIYRTQKEALNALMALGARGFQMDRVHLIGKANIMDDNIKVKSLEMYKMAPLFLFISAGLILGLLSGEGVVNIPGFDFMKETSQIINSFLGFNFGLMIGGIITIALSIILKNENRISYKEHMIEKKFLVVVNGSGLPPGSCARSN